MSTGGGGSPSVGFVEASEPSRGLRRLPPPPRVGGGATVAACTGSPAASRLSMAPAAASRSGAETAVLGAADGCGGADCAAELAEVCAGL
ncbi:MAG: hypothetical protein MUF54_25070, partial [Polyangiaceae bacterium]|nr:hypothetical protein [Polyangiaceae bacterium]